MPPDAVCLDASFYITIIMPDEASAEAEAIFSSWVEHGSALHAPSIFVWECLNAIRRAAVAQRLSQARAKETCAEILDLPITLASIEDRAQRVWDSYVLEFDLPTVYDALYLTLADGLGCELWTEDHRLYRTVHDQLPWVRCASLESK